MSVKATSRAGSGSWSLWKGVERRAKSCERSGWSFSPEKKLAPLVIDWYGTSNTLRTVLL